MATVKANRAGFLYIEGALTADYVDNTVKFQNWAATALKIAAETADVEFSIVGGGAGGANDVDGLIKAGETLTFEELEFSKLALRGTGASVRAWAYK